MDSYASSLVRRAFGDNADKSLIITYESHRAAHHYISSALAEANGIAILQGPLGAGKTTIINELVPLLMRESPVAVFDGANLASQPHVGDVLRQFGIDVEAKQDEQLLQTLETFVRNQAGSGRAPVLIVDNAHRLEPSSCSLLNWLAALDVRERWAIRFVLTGTENLAELVTHFSMRHFERRHPVVFNMGPLSRRETVIYLRNKFIAAGGENAEEVLSLDACEELHELSRGWPGRLNDHVLQMVSDIGENCGTQSPPRIIVSSEGKTIAECALIKSDTIIGRDNTADIVIDDLYVSKRHAMLQFDGTVVVLIDLDSTNGTRLNSTDTLHSELCNNDIISIGKHRLKIEDLPIVSDKMAEKIRRADTLTLDDPEDIRRSRAKRNIRRLQIGNELPVVPNPSPPRKSGVLRKSASR